MIHANIGCGPSELPVAVFANMRGMGPAGSGTLVPRSRSGRAPWCHQPYTSSTSQHKGSYDTP